MSVTFSLPREFCLAVRPIDDTEAESDRYWRETVTVDAELNVANANARWILSAVLDESAEDLCDSLPSSVFLQRVSCFFDASQGVKADRVSNGGRWVQQGRTLEQVERYLESLRRLGDLALERGAPEIQWG